MAAFPVSRVTLDNSRETLRPHARNDPPVQPRICYNDPMPKRMGQRPPSPTSNPRGSYRPPYPHPPTTYPYPRRNRSAEIITISLLVAAFMLLGLGGMLWIVQARLVFGPTPTPTATRGAPLTATPDYLTTRVAQDFLTQQAYQMALLGTRTPTPAEVITPVDPLPENTPDATNTPVIVRLPGVSAPFIPTLDAEAAATLLPDGEISPLETATSNTINLPIVVGDSPVATPTPAQVAELPTAVPIVPPTDIPTETPSPTPTLLPDTPTPTPTETLVPPSPTPSATLLPPGQPFVVSSLQAFVQGQPAPLRLGPSNVYTVVATLNPETRVTALGRNPSGEWLYICCVDIQQNQTPTWVRQAYVRPRDNQLQNGAPEGSNPNDVRWLAIQPPPSYLPLVPTPVPPGADDYPFYRYDRHGQGRVDQLPVPPLGEAWPADASAGGALGSPVAVMGSSVLVGSADNHLYSFERQTGSQRWRFNLCQDGCTQIVQAPMVYENDIFIVDQNLTIWALTDLPDPAPPPQVLWRVRLDQPALTSFNIYSETLFLATGEGPSHTLLALDRDNGGVRWRQDTTGPTLRYPIIGDQLVYAADSFIAAYDVLTGELVWENRNVQNIMAGPVYGSPGPSSVAELYMVGGDNRIYALDANTGVELWNIDNGEAASSLALNENSLFVAGDGYVKAISRQDRNQRWRTAIIGGPVMGGPLVDAIRVLVVTQAGNVHLLNNDNGSATSVPSIATAAGGAPAVSGPYIFIPGVDGRLYELLGSQ